MVRESNFKRNLLTDLNIWKKNENRKPLILRGARQVGKTTLVKQFSNSFSNTIHLNLERKEDVYFFETFNDVETIINALFTKYSISFDKKKETLLFIDEIQESVDAISLLRYFYEDVPELHVIATGSLLEHVMKNVKSFPVGRVQYLYLHPFNFVEYLNAKSHTGAVTSLNVIPVEEYAHSTLLKLFNEYAIIGGMPEVVRSYIHTESISDLALVYENIWETYKNDVEKYASNKTEARVINHIMSTASSYVDQRIKFQNFGNSNYRSREVGEALRNLDDAKVIQLIYPSTNITPPILSDFKKSPRLQFLDTGLVNYELNIQADMLAFDDLSDMYKGAIIPHLITQEMISLNTYKNRKPNFWVREKAQSSAEVDLIYNYKGIVFPIEIKSGKVGKLRSLHQFVDRSSHPYAIRVYAGKFSIEEHKTVSGKSFYLMNLPYYLTTLIESYMAYLIEIVSQQNLEE
jgi:predicted AAA+ superfamily ATPase